MPSVFSLNLYMQPLLRTSNNYAQYLIIRAVADKYTYFSDSNIANIKQKRFEYEPKPLLLLYIVVSSFLSNQFL
jgi:hypothetical protein